MFRSDALAGIRSLSTAFPRSLTNNRFSSNYFQGWPGSKTGLFDILICSFNIFTCHTFVILFHNLEIKHKLKTNYIFHLLQNIIEVMSKRTSNWFLKHIKSNSKYFLKYGSTNIGRATHCDIRIPDIDVSRQHCTVDVLDNDILHICDLSVSLFVFFQILSYN